MFTVYVLFSLKDRHTYVGCTKNLNKRLEEHNSGRVPSTKLRTPLRLVYQETFEDEHKAFLREKHYKSSWGRRRLRKMIGDLATI